MPRLYIACQGDSRSITKSFNAHAHAPLRSRRQRHMVKAISKFYTHAISDDANQRQKRNWEIIHQYGTVSPFVRRTNLPDTTAEMADWTRHQLTVVNVNAWSGANEFKRKIPSGKSLPPAYTSNISTTAENMASKWYMNTIPGSRTLSNLKEELASLLAKNQLNDSEVADLETHLYQLINVNQ